MATGTNRAGAGAPGVIVGCAIGYGHAQVAPFLRSLRAAGFGGHVVLALANDLPTAERARIEADGAIPFLVTPTPWISRSRGWAARVARGAVRIVTPRSAKVALTIQGPASRRWLVYSAMAEALPTVFGPAPWLFLTDVRDVHFQTDPSARFDTLVADAPLHLFAEGAPGADARRPEARAGASLVADQEYNAEWIRYIVGDDEVGRYAGCQVLCSGTILLRPDVLAPMADRMIGLMGRNRPRTAPLGVDQGVMNVLFHSDALADLGPVVHPNADGGVFTMHACPPETWTLADGTLRVNGAAPPVVHQYDRFPDLVHAWDPG